ncbi:non-ribosomal peptide synthetase [Acetobacter orientalis]|nr:non-ribosomal peptide synthetase [Acetobacter orientalis]
MHKARQLGLGRVRRKLRYVKKSRVYPRLTFLGAAKFPLVSALCPILRLFSLIAESLICRFASYNSAIPRQEGFMRLRVLL